MSKWINMDCCFRELADIIECNLFLPRYWSRTNNRHFLLVFARLFLFRSVHPFKCLVILNMLPLRLTLHANIFYFSVLTHIRGSNRHLVISAPIYIVKLAPSHFGTCHCQFGTSVKNNFVIIKYLYIK